MVQKNIIQLLQDRLVLSTRAIAKLLKKNYAQVYYALLALKDKQIVEDVRVKEKFPSGLNYLEVRYWYLKERKKEVEKWLKSNSHTLR